MLVWAQFSDIVESQPASQSVSKVSQDGITTTTTNQPTQLPNSLLGELSELDAQVIDGLVVLFHDDGVPVGPRRGAIQVSVLGAHDLLRHARRGSEVLVQHGVVKVAQDVHNVRLYAPELGQQRASVQSLVQRDLLDAHGHPLHLLVGKEQHSVEGRVSNGLHV